MPLDTSIPMQIAQVPQTQAVNPMSLYQMAQDQRLNALREQALQQEMSRNALIMQNTMEDRRIAAAARAQAAQKAAEERARLAEYRGILDKFGQTPAVIGQRGAGYSGTGLSNDPYTPVQNELLRRGFIDQAEALAKVQKEQFAGEESKAKIPGLKAESRKKGTEADVAEYDAAVSRLVPLVRSVKSGQDAANFTNAMYDDPILGPRLERIIPRAQAVARAPAEYDADPLAWTQSHMLTGKELSDALSAAPTAKAARSEVITGADGNTYVLDKATKTVVPITMGAAGAPAAAAAPVAGAPAAGAPVSFRAAPTTDAQIKQAALKEALPAAIQTAEMTLKQVEEMIGSENLFGDQVDKFRTPGQKIPEHPGFQSAVGAGFPFLGSFSGTETTNFNKRLAQVQGKAFLDAYETLKGTGQITEKEGEKATAAKSRMDTAQSEKEFILAAREFAEIIESAVTRAKAKLGNSAAAPSATAAPSTTAPAASANGPTVSNW